MLHFNFHFSPEMLVAVLHCLQVSSNSQSAVCVCVCMCVPCGKFPPAASETDLAEFKRHTAPVGLRAKELEIDATRKAQQKSAAFLQNDSTRPVTTINVCVVKENHISICHENAGAHTHTHRNTKKKTQHESWLFRYSNCLNFFSLQIWTHSSVISLGSGVFFEFRFPTIIFVGFMNKLSSRCCSLSVFHCILGKLCVRMMKKEKMIFIPYA